MAYKTLRKRQTPESQVTATHARHLPSTSDTSATPPIPSAQTSEPRDSVSSEGTPTISLTPDTFDQDDNGSTVDPRSSNVIKRKALAKNKVAKIVSQNILMSGFRQAVMHLPLHRILAPASLARSSAHVRSHADGDH